MQEFLSLDALGLAIALVFGLLIYLFGGVLGLFFLVTLIYFLVLSYIVTRFGRERKRKLGVYEQSRGWRNVFANGIVPLFAAVVYGFNLSYNIVPADWLVVAYVASVAAITADKFASELGVLDGKPIMLLTLKPARKGMSGGVTPLGLFASLVAALMISLVLFWYWNYLWIAVVSVSGLIGSMVDSVLGYFEEKGTGNKFTSNIGCAIAGWCVSLLLLLLLAP
jgi:uncharacterized protein (TIGR00297 family)